MVKREDRPLRRGLAATCLFLASLVPAIAVAEPPRPEGIVVRVTVGLVQVDAVVTDREGRAVTNLGPGDFEVKEGGQVREITHASYVRLGSMAAPGLAAATPGAAAPTAPVASMRVQPRSLVIVIDDLTLLDQSARLLKDALHRFVDTELKPGDSVAIVRTSGGVGALQKFTSSARVLHAAIEDIPLHYQGWERNEAGEGLTSEMPFSGGSERGGGNPAGERSGEGRKALGSFREEEVASAVLATIRSVVSGLAPLAGRKSVVVFSDGFSAFDFGTGGRITTLIQEVTAAANRASVVLYTVNGRTLEVNGAQAADQLTYLGPGEIAALASGGLKNQFGREEGLWFLADQTGGAMIRSGNDFGRALDRVLAAESGYYVIGYVPPASFFEASNGRPLFHKLHLAVRRPGLRLRTRSGFYGVADEDRPVEGAPDRLMAAVTSPFAAGDIPIRLQTLFLDDEQMGPILRAMVKFDSAELTFKSAGDGSRAATLDVRAALSDAGAKRIPFKDQTFTVRAPEGGEPAASAADLVYAVVLPVPKPGSYLFRVAVRDRDSDRLGAATDFVRVPDLKKGRLATSGIVVRPIAAAPTATLDAARSGRVSDRLHPGMTIEYVFQVLNARTDPATRKPRVETQVRLTSGAEMVFAGPRTPLAAEEGPPRRRLAVSGRLALSPRLPTGDYTLELVVVDALAPAKEGVVVQRAEISVDP